MARVNHTTAHEQTVKRCEQEERCHGYRYRADKSADCSEAEKNQAACASGHCSPDHCDARQGEYHPMPGRAFEHLHRRAQCPAHRVTDSGAGDVHQQAEHKKKQFAIVWAKNSVAEHFDENGGGWKRAEQHTEKRVSRARGKRAMHQEHLLFFLRVAKEAAALRFLSVDRQQSVQPCASVSPVNRLAGVG